MRQIVFATCAVLMLASGVAAQAADKTFRLAVPQGLRDTGLMTYMLPRFSLKTATRVTIVAPADDADAVFGDSGVVTFEGAGQVWRLEVGGDPDAQRFADWLVSDVGRNTVDGFMVDGTAPFTARVKETTKVAVVQYDGDAAQGAALSLTLCGRCHVVGAVNRMKASGSSPSFAVLRTLPNWPERFTDFYTLNPHPSFTQVTNVTPPFDETRPSPITPVVITLAELNDIMAFVAAVTPADLGAPIRSK